MTGSKGCRVRTTKASDTGPSPNLPTEVERELDVLATAKQHIQDAFDRELLHEPATAPSGDTSLADTCRLGATVAAPCAQLEPKAQRRGVAIGLEIAGELGQRVGPTPLREVVFNLVDNAIDAAASSVCVALRPEEDAPRGRSGIVVLVSDDGPGIAALVIDNLYEPFVSTMPGGTGMGLAIADALVAELGGHLHHERHGGTTRFVLTLPSLPGEDRLEPT